jgi:hypothetical protein
LIVVNENIIIIFFYKFGRLLLFLLDSIKFGP